MRTEIETRARPGLVLGLACAAQAMVGLDTAIVNVAVPSIQRELGVDAGVVQWVVVAYGLLLGGFLLVGGRMTDQVGRRRVFLAGVVVFTVASFVAGAAPHVGLLIAARGVQGFGAALIAPAALSLLAVTFPDGRERVRALGIFGAIGGVAGSFGVVVGGLLAAGPGWRWSFFLNVPVGVVFVVIALTFLVPDPPRDRDTRLDLRGATVVTGGLLLLVYSLHHGSVLTWVAALGLLGLFAWIEARSAHPLVPLSAWRNRALAPAFLTFCALLGFIFLGSLLMQQELGYSPATTGVAWLATTATIFVAAMGGARLAARVPVRALLVTGLTLTVVAALWLTRATPDSAYVTGLLPAFLLAGVGFGLCGPAIQISALTGVSRSEAGLVSGLVETMREVGGAAGVALVATVLVSGSGFPWAFGLVAAVAALGVLTTVLGRTSS
ncbi:MFS transporter [Cryptosporangium arvum]|uniref:MFS transporter n=1 Tax=Cryptosporangium arvum TaxID=80871 RepID=UPI0009FCA246|nr:MFS transporter [Cryptosporangium arvum]